MLQVLVLAHFVMMGLIRTRLVSCPVLNVILDIFASMLVIIVELTTFYELSKQSD